MTDGDGVGRGAVPGSSPDDYRVEQAFRYGGAASASHASPLVLLALLQLLSVAAVAYAGNLVTAALVPAHDYDATTRQLEGGGLAGTRSILTLLFLALALAVGVVLQAGLVRMSLSLTRGRKLGVGEALRDLGTRQVTLAALVIAGLTLGASLFYVVPGLVVLFLTSFTLFFVVDRGEDALAGIRSSVRLVAREPGALAVFYLAAAALYVVGACLCGLGLLVAVPVVAVSQAYTFRTLSGEPLLP